MHLLLMFVLSFLCTHLFVYSFRHLPCSWLFDENYVLSEDYPRPHPYADKLILFPHFLTLLLIFFAVTFSLLEKVALMDVLGGLCLFWFLLQIGVLDFLYRSIPDQWSLAIAFLGILSCLASYFRFGPEEALPQLQDKLPSLLLWLLLFILLFILPKAVHRPSMMGLGDIKLLFALAITLPGVLYLMLLIRTSFIGGLMAMVQILRKQTDQGVPFATALALGMFSIILCN